ncbi:hypothetical protein ABZ725_51210 [Streptomyces sp. NPDC006872]|uniref:hypothetical protein n=1 Tax=Streptomyces sp. NPDC006872 TaxID=3155720 RepID=UPI00340BB749
MQNLSPWEFCQFLGELMVADATTGKAQDRFFCELATRVTTAARVRSAAVPAERLAPAARRDSKPGGPAAPEQRLRHGAPPYSVWITYRLEAGASEHTREAAVSGYHGIA